MMGLLLLMINGVVGINSEYQHMLSYVFTTSSAATVVLSKVEQQKATSPGVVGVTYDTAL